MSDYTIADVRAEVERYLAREIDASELEGHLIPMVWEEVGPPDVLDLAHDVVLLLFEHSGGHITERQLRDGLRELLLAPAPS